ncbi:hypothetical protein [Actinoplanes nipponensis]|uniref:hypothetical protein n=1 Tax=Actinoplanes nipponensis TaxID=135950 RepID=UPI0031F098DF
MRPPELDVTFRLYELDCQATEDAGSDGDEPYLWVLGFKVDAETLDPGLPPTVRVQVFRGVPASPWIAGAGSVHTGEKRAIPAALGTRSFRLKPALIPLAGWFPGLAGVICLLWDQDGMTVASSEAGHKAFDAKLGGALAGELNTMLAGGYDDALSRDADGNVAPGRPDSPDLTWRLARLRDAGGRRSVVRALTAAVKDQLSGSIKDAVTDVASWTELIDIDDLLGVEAEVYLGDELGGVRDFQLRFTDDESDYTVRGQAGGRRVHAARILSSVTNVERRLEQVHLLWLKVCWFAAREYLARAFRLRTTTRFVLDITTGEQPVAVRWFLGDTVLAPGQGSVMVNFEPLAPYVPPPQDALAGAVRGRPGRHHVHGAGHGAGAALRQRHTASTSVRSVRCFAFAGDPDIFPPPATPLPQLLDMGYLQQATMSVTGVQLSMEHRYYEDVAACKKVIHEVDRKHIAVDFGRLHIEPGDPAPDREQVLARVNADVRVLVAAGLEIVAETAVTRLGGHR